jgi:hypothetical protein
MAFNSNVYLHTAISIKVVHAQSEKVEYERERLLGIANSLPSSPKLSRGLGKICRILNVQFRVRKCQA